MTTEADFAESFDSSLGNYGVSPFNAVWDNTTGNGGVGCAKLPNTGSGAYIDCLPAAPLTVYRSIHTHFNFAYRIVGATAPGTDDVLTVTLFFDDIDYPSVGWSINGNDIGGSADTGWVEVSLPFWSGISALITQKTLSNINVTANNLGDSFDAYFDDAFLVGGATTPLKLFTGNFEFIERSALNITMINPRGLTVVGNTVAVVATANPADAVVIERASVADDYATWVDYTGSHPQGRINAVDKINDYSI
jgi:hypothetical protein